MLKAKIHYFTGTGNSYFAAKFIGDKLKDVDYEVEYFAVTKDSIKNIGTKDTNCDLAIFTFPVYACSVPQIMQDYMKKLKKVNDTKTVVISTNGETDFKKTVPGYEGQCLLQAKRIVEKKGYKVFYTNTIGLPENITYIVNTPKKEDVDALIEDAKLKLEEVFQKIVKNERFIKPCNILNQIWSWLFGILYNVFGRRVLGKMLISTNKCNSCKICEKACPNKSIKLKFGKPRWNWDCMGCTRCINICPKQAIQTSFIRFFIALALFPLLVFILSLFNIVNIYLNILINSFAFFVIFYFVDKILFLFEFIPILRNILWISHTKKFRRYMLPKFNPLSKEL
ncbi:MAG: hypothetical protein A2086_06505 [Spirochaetes bacterium GWD1_27_9]|nr:MAG: hypothetical protein A2Y34_10930 [Spirochaetes bacterium GWC1_27_15]OHD37140.1 MAG: hypothetical protein A2086_06505 [Spirochaetes bacterium GWD1_27_9]